MCLFCQVTSLKMLKRSVASMSLDHGMVLLCEQKSWYLKILVHCVVLENIHTHPKECYWEFQEGGGGVFSKAKISFKGRNGPKLKFSEGLRRCSFTTKASIRGVYGHFLEQFTFFSLNIKYK